MSEAEANRWPRWTPTFRGSMNRTFVIGLLAAPVQALTKGAQRVHRRPSDLGFNAQRTEP